MRIDAERATYLYRNTLRHLQACLDFTQFARIHRGIPINADRVREIHSLFGGSAEITLRDGTRLGLSRRYRLSVRVALGLR